MNITTIPVGPYAVNCSIIWGDKKEALVVDPGFDCDEIIEVLKENDLTVAAYIMTHGHADHSHDLNAVYSKMPAPIVMHADDEAWAFGPSNTIPPYYEVPKKPAAIERSISEECSFTDGELEYEIICTPGHSPGGICIYFKAAGLLIAGDTLFRESVGRTDLPGGDARTLTASLKKLITLPEETKVICGHGPATTIGHEKKHNFYMR